MTTLRSLRAGWMMSLRKLTTLVSLYKLAAAWFSARQCMLQYRCDSVPSLFLQSKAPHSSNQICMMCCCAPAVSFWFKYCMCLIATQMLAGRYTQRWSSQRLQSSCNTFTHLTTDAKGYQMPCIEPCAAAFPTVMVQECCKQSANCLQRLSSQRTGMRTRTVSGSLPGCPTQPVRQHLDAVSGRGPPS